MRNDERIEALVAYVGGQRGTISGHRRACACAACCDAARTRAEGIEAIREMQAELAGRDADTVEKPEPGEWTEARENDAERWLLCWPHHEGGCKCAICISEGYLKDAMKEIKRLKEELRIAETSWSFEEVKRIIAERDKLLKRNNALCDALCDDLDAARDERGAALVESHDMRRQRDLARNDERCVSGERDTLRDKLRATEKENCSLAAGRHAAREDAIDSHRKYTKLCASLRVLVTGESQDDD